jgi:hypothetical protein
MTVTAFIPTRAVTVLLALWDALPSNTGLPWQTVALSWFICTVYIAGIVTHRTNGVIVARIKTKSPLTIAQWVDGSPTMSTFKQARFIVWPTLPKSAAI